eukprot:tig00000553_g2104.t1
MADGSGVVVDVWSDIACPWCYVGKRRFQQALKTFSQSNPDTPVEVRFHPYMIDPATAKDGEDYLAYNRRRWGGDGWTGELRRAGKAVGAPFGDWKTWPNTLLAHCLAEAAYAAGRGDEAVEALFAATYEKGQNVSDRATLERIAVELGLDPSACFSEEAQAAVKRKDAAAKRGRFEIGGVPFWVMRGPSEQALALEGAQGPSAFTAALRKAASSSPSA